MKHIMHKLLLSCKRAGELIEKQSLFQLRWNEQLQLRMHVRICKFCAIYQQQSILLDHLIRHQMMETGDLKLVLPVKNELLKSKIILHLDEQIGSDDEAEYYSSLDFLSIQVCKYSCI